MAGHVGAKVEIRYVNNKVASAAMCVINGAVDVQFGIDH